MQPITAEQEKHLDEFEEIKFNNVASVIKSEHIYCYGSFNIECKEDLDYADKFNLVGDAENCYITSNYDLKSGTARYEGNVPKRYPTYNNIEWFKYNYLLIGKPERIIIFKCDKSVLV